MKQDWYRRDGDDDDPEAPSNSVSIQTCIHTAIQTCIHTTLRDVLIRCRCAADDDDPEAPSNSVSIQTCIIMIYKHVYIPPSLMCFGSDDDPETPTNSLSVQTCIHTAIHKVSFSQLLPPFPICLLNNQEYIHTYIHTYIHHRQRP